MLLLPPGSGKSTYTSTLFPPWYLGRNQHKCIITASYAQKLSTRFGRKCRNLVGSPAYKRIFGFGLSADSSAKDEWETEGGGEYTATSVDGSVTGRRGDVILIDDPIKGRKDADSEATRETLWEWWLHDLRPRLKPHGSIIICCTRWHEADLAGRILPEDYNGSTGKITSRDGEEWQVISIQAEAEANDPLGRAPGEFLWPEWFTQESFKREKIIQGPRNWNALYQQRPSPETGDYFKKEWLRWYDAEPNRATLKIYGASDYAVTASGGDFTVHLVAGVDPNDDIYILDIWRAQASSEVWAEQLVNLMKRWNPLQWAEESGQIEKGVGPFLTKRMNETKTYVFRKQFPSSTDKATRAQPIRGRMAMGKVYLPRKAEWVNGLVSEIMVFPAGKNDDQVDCLSLIGRLLDVMMHGQKQIPTFPLRGANEMTMDEIIKYSAEHRSGLVGGRI